MASMSASIARIKQDALGALGRAVTFVTNGGRVESAAE